MVAKLGNMDEPLPQDSFEGVDEDEWVSVLWRRVTTPRGVCGKKKIAPHIFLLFWMKEKNKVSHAYIVAALTVCGCCVVQDD